MTQTRNERLLLAGDGLLFFVIGTFSARYAVALNVHVATHFAGTIGRVWGVLQA